MDGDPDNYTPLAPLTPEEYAAQYHATHPSTPQDSVEDTAIKDPEPVLATVAPQFAEEVTGVDVDSLPAFKPFQRMLPAQRIKAQAELAKVATSLPVKFLDQDGSGVSIDADINSLTSEDLDAVAGMVARVQDIVLDAAADREAMENWLLDQENPMDAVMFAFTKYQATLGN